MHRSQVKRPDPQRLRQRKVFVVLVLLGVVAVAIGSSGLYSDLIHLTGGVESHGGRTPESAGALAWTAHHPATPKILYREVDASPGIRSSTSGTPQALVLTGTIRGASPEAGSAFIGTDPDHPQIYRAGALLANGARLTKIFRRYVVLEKDGLDTRLYLNSSRGFPWFSHQSAALTVGGEAPARQAVATVTEVFTDYVRPTPVFEGAAITGFRVYPGRHSGVFMKMGLQPGDVITALNGAPLTDPTEAVAAFRQVATGGQTDAQVLRHGRTMDITLDGSLITNEQQRQREMRYLAQSSLPPGL